MKPTFWSTVKGMCRALRKNPRLSGHLMAILWSFLRNYSLLHIEQVQQGDGSTIVIALTEHMGDIVAAEPISRLARARFPTARIVWITRKPFKEIVDNYPSVNEVITVECLTEWLLLWSLKSDKEIVWDLHLSNRVCPHCNIGFQKSGLAASLTYKTYYNYGNLLAVNCLSAGLSILTDAPTLSPPGQTINKVNRLELPEAFIAIHCKSNDTRRDWRKEKWRGLVSWITTDLGLSVVEIGSEPFIVQANDDRTKSLCGMLSIIETAEVLKRASLFIGIDSGPAHLANAVGTPGVILLGNHGPFRKYVPYSGNYADGTGAELIQWDDLPEAIPLDRVIASVSIRLKTLSGTY